MTEGLTQREIARKLNISAEEYEQREKAIRYKLNLMGDPDPVIAEVIAEYKLTKREADILKLLREKTPTDVMANELHISVETVRSHISKLLKKLGIAKRQDVSAWIVSNSKQNQLL